MKKGNLVIAVCIVVLVSWGYSSALDVMPKLVGSASTDSVRINFGTIDTTYYPAVANADSLIILVYPPDNAAPESTANGGTGVFNLTTGYYQYHRRGSNATPDLGTYTVCVIAWKGGAKRGIGTCSYEVTGAGTYYYLLQDSTRDEVVNIDAWNPITDNDSLIIDQSTRVAVGDTNTDPFNAGEDSVLADESTLWGLGVQANLTAADSTMIMTDIKNLDSWTPLADNVGGVVAAVTVGTINNNTITESSFANNAITGAKIADAAIDYATFAATAPSAWWNEGKTGYALSQTGLDTDTSFGNLQTVAQSIKAQGDSVTQAIADANKANFKATGFATSSEGDSIIQAIADANKANFKATGFATSSEGDSIIAAISDANKPNFKATGFATSGDGDSIIAAIADANKPNFRATGFATAGSVHTAITDANKANFKATGFATAESLHNAIADANKANFKATVIDSVRKVYLVDSLDQTVTATVDTEAVARSVWNDDIVAQASRTVTASCAGSGARTVVIQTLSYTDSTTGISGVKVDIYDSTGGEFKEALLTNTSGVDTVSLDDGTYTIHLRKTSDAISGGSPQYKGVSSDTTHTFYVIQFDPGSPPSADKCRIWCLVSDLTSAWLSGCRLSVWIPSRYHDVTLDTTVVSPYAVSAVSNDTGFVFKDVYRSAEITAGNGETIKFFIELRDPSGRLIARFFGEIPDQANWEIEW